MKLLFFLSIPMFLFSFDYKYIDRHAIENFSEEQLEVLNTSYKVGNYYSTEPGMGILLAAIAIVENDGYKKDKNDNHVCGPHQIDTVANNVSCEAVENSPFASAVSALRNLEYWTNVYNKQGIPVSVRPLEKRLRMYNVGYTDHEHQWEYLYKVQVTELVLTFYKDLWVRSL